MTDGEVFYDLLVDWGYRGQEQFGGLAFDLAACSGLITEGQAKQLKDTLHAAVAEAFTRLDGPEEEEQERLDGPFSPA